MQSSLDLLTRAAELREQQTRAWFPSTRRRLSRKAFDYEQAARAAAEVERLRRAAAWDARRRA